MTIEVIIKNNANEGASFRAIAVTDQHDPSQHAHGTEQTTTLGPKEEKTFTLWKEKRLVISEAVADASDPTDDEAEADEADEAEAEAGHA